MPALRAFGRRWNVGSDDLVFPGLVEISVRTVWFIVLFIFYLIKRKYVTCDYALKIRIFYICTLCLLATQIVLCVVMTVLSSRGTMVNKSARRHVSTVLYLRLACFVPEVVWAIIGTIWTFEKADDCPPLLVKSGKGVILVEWILIASIIISIILTFDPLGRRHMRKRSMKDYNRVWQRRCRVLCCCIWGDENRKGAFDEIAEMLTKFFKYKDIVLSDVIAGLVLLHLRCESISYSSQKSRSHPEQWTSGSRNNASPDRYSQPSRASVKDWMTLENADYYCRYAVGSYGRYNYIMCRNCGQRCGLCRKYKMPCQSSTFSQDQVIGDNTCQCHMASVLQYTGIDPDDIIFANFANQIYETPYYVALDESRKSVVISIRGTKSFQDAITDLTALGERFETVGTPPGFVHGGMLQVAQNIKQQLEECKVLDKIPEGYNLILTGHSLGAGAAVLLSLMLRSKFPHLRCFAYSPPGGLVSMALQVYTEEFVFSIVLGNDVIPRLSLNSMENLKYAILDAIKKSKMPKYKILATGFVAVCCGWRDRIKSEDDDSDVKPSVSTNNLFDMTEESIHRENDATDTSDNITDGIPQELINAIKSDEDSIICDIHNDHHALRVQFENSDICVDNADHVTGVDIENNADSVDKADHVTRVHRDNGVTDVDTVDGVDTFDGVASQKNIRRHREIVEPRIRPTTYQQFYQSHMKWRREREKLCSLVADPLYLPGNVLHLVEEAPVTQLMHPKYHIRWARPEDFCEIMVSPNMLHHHHGYILRRVLQNIIAEKYCKDKTSDSTPFIT